MEGWEFDKKVCVECGRTAVSQHHVMHGTANRAMADRYGYIIPLCQQHHMGRNGIHFNKDFDLAWKQKAQRHYEKYVGTRDDFIRDFGKSYIIEEGEHYEQMCFQW